MSWLDNLRRPEPPRKQLLFFAKEELTNEYFAVIRMSYFSKGKISKVTEMHIHCYDLNAKAKFYSTVKFALKAGADVSALCVTAADELGIEPA
jgi:hypothetical protein|tara:strand:+ start:721 stop:999 length:279 start_codon:yes stop_codon:yes gene_type:complete